MNKYQISQKIENFAPINSQEDWDCSGWAIDFETNKDVKKIMLCLTVTEDILSQAKEQNCDMIVSHHPLFFIPFDWQNYGIDIYCAHTNLDKATGGTTDTLIEAIGLKEFKTSVEHDFLRIVDYTTDIYNFSELIKIISPNAKIINNKNTVYLNKIAFCAGSGSEFINDAKNFGADCFVTGDLKFHTALESDIVIFDIGHFESEILILPVFEKLIKEEVEVIYAKEKSPFAPLM